MIIYAKRIVLIADDDRNLVDALARRCVSIGLHVERAYDGLSALSKIDRLKPHLVILDVNMPGGSGLSVLEMMAGNEHLRSIPVIILTGQENLGTMRRCHELLAYFVPKCPEVWPRIEPLLVEHFGRAALDYWVSQQQASHQVRISAESGGMTPEANENRNRWVGDTFDRSVDEMSGQAATAELAIDRSAAESTNRPWILCIDDDPEMLQRLELRLEQNGVGLHQAHSGMDGYRCAFMEPARAIILDYEMPDGNGDYVLGRLKENPLTKEVPVIVLTGHRDKCLERKMYNLGAKHFFNKPIVWDELWPVLQTYIDGPLQETGSRS